MSEIFNATVAASKLQAYIDVFTPLVDEGKVHFSESGLSCSVVDPANVGLIGPAELSAEAFETWDVPGQGVVGVPFDTVDERLSPAKPDDLVTMTLDMSDRTLRLQFRNITQSVALIDPDAVRDVKNDPDIDVPNSVVLEGSQLEEARQVVDYVTDHLIIDGEPDERQVVIRGEGDVDDVELEYGDGETIQADVPEQTRVYLSLDYVTDLIKPIPGDAEVWIEFGDEHPITMDWEAAGGDVSVHQILSPRIVTE